jgi:glycosyltransferase involved in cell wall biosynthesis
LSVFGNKQLQEKLKNEFDIDRAFNISDQALAKIFSPCKLNICPQKWEMFGYVIAESNSCGTPVLAFTLMGPALMGPAEIITQTKMGVLVNDEKEFLRKIKGFDFAKTKENKEKTILSMGYGLLR